MPITLSGFDGSSCNEDINPPDSFSIGHVVSGLDGIHNIPQISAGVWELTIPDNGQDTFYFDSTTCGGGTSSEYPFTTIIRMTCGGFIDFIFDGTFYSGETASKVCCGQTIELSGWQYPTGSASVTFG